MTLRTFWRRGGTPATWDTPSGVTLRSSIKEWRPVHPTCWRAWCFSLISSSMSSIRWVTGCHSGFTWWMGSHDYTQKLTVYLREVFTIFVLFHFCDLETRLLHSETVDKNSKKSALCKLQFKLLYSLYVDYMIDLSVYREPISYYSINRWLN